MMSALADTYLSVTINGFSEGSIVVDYTVNFKTEETVMNATSNSTSPSSTFINSTLVMTAFTDSLMMAMEMGIINVTIDEMSIMVTGKLNDQMLLFTHKLLGVGNFHELFEQARFKKFHAAKTLVIDYFFLNSGFTIMLLLCVKLRLVLS